MDFIERIRVKFNINLPKFVPHVLWSLEFTDEASLALIDEASEEHFLNCFAQRVKNVAREDFLPSDEAFHEEAMNHVINNGGENYQIPLGLKIKLRLILKQCREQVQYAKQHLDRLGATWRVKLLVGLRKLLGSANVADIHEIKVDLIDNVYKAFCPRCDHAIVIQEKSRNVFNAYSFYRHVENHYDFTQVHTSKRD